MDLLSHPMFSPSILRPPLPRATLTPTILMILLRLFVVPQSWATIPQCLLSFPLLPVEEETLHIVFPIFGKIDCTENTCSRPFANDSWSSIKNSLKRHLEKDHDTRIRSSFFWCSVCKLRIGRSPTSHGCLQGKPVLPPSTPFHWRCDICPSSFPSEAGLRNHKRMHKMNEIRDKGEQLVVAKPVFRGRRVPRLPDAVSSSAADECVSDPALVIAQQVDCPGIPTPPDSQANSEACLLDPFITDMKSICDQDPSDGAFTFLCVTYDQAIAEISSALLPPLRPSVSRNEPPRFDPLDAKEVQRLYKRNRPKAIREISGKSGERCSLPADQLESYFSEAWDSQHVVANFFPTDTSGRGCVLDSPFNVKEIINKLKSAENTSAGPDRLCYNDWKCIPRAAQFLQALFNACVHLRRVPPVWKKSTTILLPKKGDISLPCNWRPIALSSTAYKLFTKCLAARLSTWCEQYNILSPCQKGFTPHDGILEHNFVLQQSLEQARLQRKELCIAWLDVTNAFGALPHSAIFEALTAAGTGEQFVDVIRDIYSNASTQILSGQSTTKPIGIKSGVKQGCPISGLLFNICVDPVIRSIQGIASAHRVLAFADDVCLLASSPTELQAMLDSVFSQFSALGLSLNAQKSHSFHFNGAPPAGTRNTNFTINSTSLHPIVEGGLPQILRKACGSQYLSGLQNLLRPFSTRCRCPWLLSRTLDDCGCHVELRLPVFPIRHEDGAVQKRSMGLP
ncbi:Retrovirus-related Pol polyprotein from type-1 retrotransposable element R2 [Araneus ventricosus]|uniref:Retrovirus-related Pol polyprotein from type-1 retrotransposable element R2 n=1 Tax=Araneus ventricosus TaxID=182803 RepID=A0A4Y2KRA8_ARAVE|nr:Retrovirus-related Pol polyprotein from type-1 retrotransposable element R2 [Araneus ventricosus]